MTVTHQDESVSRHHPLDMLERTVEENGWAFERSGRDELNLSVAGRWSDHHFSFTWREDLQSLHLSSAFDMRVNGEARLADVAALLMYVNARMWIGHFDLWPEDGTIVFRHAMIFPDAYASASQCEALLNLALEACEHYYPAFQFVLWGGKTAEEAVAAAILECAGQA
ncbi:MAG TPA: YbjN domain-containing protein [Rhizomicrobium sp.]